MSFASGPLWCQQFPTSVSLDDLVEPFQGNVRRFLAAIDAAAAGDPGAGITRSIAATYRPPERAYLMHWAWGIARGLPANMCRPGDKPAVPVPPDSVPALANVDIDWTHGGDYTAARLAAEQMIAVYGMRACASLTTNHEKRLAIDMTIKTSPNVQAIYIADANGTDHQVTCLDDLRTVGATYGVMKLPLAQLDDPPHWSIDGH